MGEPQDESKVILGLNITKEEEKVHFAVEDVQTLYNHIRGLIDWPMPYGVVDGKRIKFCKVRMRKEDHQAKPGEILGFKIMRWKSQALVVLSKFMNYSQKARAE